MTEQAWRCPACGRARGEGCGRDDKEPRVGCYLLGGPPAQTTDSWSICLTPDRVYVSADIRKERTADELLDALRAIQPLLLAAADLEVDGEWAE